MPRVITGTEGDDELRDRPYGDPVIIYGLGGNDTIVSQEGSGDEIYGGDGDDLIRVYSQGFYDGGDGYDTLWLPGTGGLDIPRVSLRADSTYTSFEHLYIGGIHDPGTFTANSSKFGDGLVSLSAKFTGSASVTITLDTKNFVTAFDLSEFGTSTYGPGGPNKFTIRGNERDNIISGTSAHDTISGEGGNDTIVWGGFAQNTAGGQIADGDDVDGGAGADLIRVVASGQPHGGSAAGGTGFDTLSVRAGDERVADFLDSAITGFEALELNGRGSAGGLEARFLASHLVSDIGEFAVRGTSGGSETLVVYAVNGRADLSSLVFTDWDRSDQVIIRGGTGSDTLYGSSANDVLDGGAGADVMNGGLGDDRYIVNSPLDRVGEGSRDGGLDTVVASVSYDLSSASGIENLELTAAARAATGVGNALANRITGNGYDNVLFGGAGDDVLLGGGGADRLYGGLGNDILTGGRGADVFVFDTALGPTNVDTVSGFAHGVDKIWLDSGHPFQAFEKGPLSAEAFATHLVYDQATGNLSYDADGAGSGPAVLFARLSPGQNVTFDHTDVLIV
ncbi:hypothetical protein ACFSCV_16890 [Methylopila henanensis]|uniref:Calcium-binding protein n=1 Tax=Methylopila henanensis TaxID=873516 RepID=A0ABW4K932_9HYPH